MLVGSFATREWFPDFRKPNDVDIYAASEDFIRLFERVNGPVQRVNEDIFRTNIDGVNVDITVDREASGVRELIEANAGGLRVNLFGVDLTLARPTTLLIIKRVHSNFKLKGDKNRSDLSFLESKIHSNPSDGELGAYKVRLQYIQEISDG